MSARRIVTVALCIAAISFSYAMCCENTNFRSTSFRQRASLFLHAQSSNSDEATPSRLVQQEQLFEELSRKNADTIAALSISERTKRAMLAEVVEDEIFMVSEQIVDLVQKNGGKSDTENYEEQVKELKSRNVFLQQLYRDLVSGRPSSLLNSVDSVKVDGSNGMNGSFDDNEFR